MADLNLTISPPDWAQYTDPGNFVAWWKDATHGIFPIVFLGLVVLGVYAKTKSPALTAVVAGIGAVTFASGNWLVLPVALALAYLLWRVIWKRTPYE